MIRTVLVGATGRMGSSILRLLPQFPELQLTGVMASARSAAPGRDLGVPFSPALPPLLESADLVIDFSSASATAANIAACVAARVPLLIGTTGLPRELDAPLASAAEVIPLLVAANTSVGVNVLLQLVRLAARVLGADYDIEIIETHHRHKRDAPSGTALALGREAALARGGSLDQLAAPTRADAGAPPRLSGQIGFAVVRGGEEVGEHEIRFLGAGESLSLRHTATDRTIFARGALLAGRWLTGQPAGRYAMSDALNI